MGNLAYMLKKIGHEVSGSDTELYPPMSEKLQEWGVKTKKGYSPENINGSDLIIVGNAISRGNPEVEEMLNSGMEYMSMPEAIGEFFLKGKKVIVVSGTHGKTTTTFLIHHILKEIGLSPGLFVGGIRQDGHAGFEIGEGDYFVIEGDEYDSAFFDKSSKFLHYRPTYLVMTSLDFDHADIFPNIDAIKSMFIRLINLVPSKGKIFYWKNSKNLTEITKPVKLIPVSPYSINSASSILSYKKGKLILNKTKSEIETSLIGSHNYNNAEVAVNVCNEIAPEKFSEIVSALSNFSGVKRRQEILYKSSHSIFIEDFAHHPVAIQETIKAVKEKFPGFKIISLFEPRSATSHRNVFQKEFSECFIRSSFVFITEIFNLKKVSSDMRLDVKKIIRKLPKHSKTGSVYCKNPADLLLQFKKIIPVYATQKILVLAMSNGAFGGIYKPLCEMLVERDRKFSL